MRGVSNRGLGGKRIETHPKQHDAESPESGQDNARRNQPISIPRAIRTVIEGRGSTGSLIVALLEESFRVQIAKDEAKKFSRGLNKSKKGAP